jgi:hypothetical protein
MAVADKGTIRFWLQRRHPNWTGDQRNHDFGTKHPQGLLLQAVKHADGTIEIVLDGLDSRPLRLREPIPRCDVRGLHVGITWTPTEVVLYLNGKPRQTLTRSASHGGESDPANVPVIG